MSTAPLTIGFLVNPLAGVGGALGLKGSDDIPPAEVLLPKHPTRSMQRAERALAPLVKCSAELAFLCWGRGMGKSVLDSLGLHSELLGDYPAQFPTAHDSGNAARAMVEAGADIIVFVGGDGTARDIFDEVGSDFPVLGIPAGVKMHSGVFAVSPEAAGELLIQLAHGGLVGLALQEVRDIDEQAFRKDIVRSRFYGEMLVPGEGRFLQHTKIGGVENADLAAADIAAWVVEAMDDARTYIIGPGSTTAAIMAELDLSNTLLGVDVVRSGLLLASDANEQDLLAVLTKSEGEATIIVTAIGGQGHVFGRGNQQISPAVIREVGLSNIDIVAAKAKIAALDGRPLLLDTNDTKLDRELSGYRSVITGYQDQILYRLATMAEATNGECSMKDDEVWRDKLSPAEYQVCREKGTEQPFTGEYWDCEKDGVYHCKCCGEPLFMSDSKFDAGCGWPSFFQPASAAVVKEEADITRGMVRTEVMCEKCGSHLGHVFNDGPNPTGLRYCINSVSITLQEAGNKT